MKKITSPIAKIILMTCVVVLSSAIVNKTFAGCPIPTIQTNPLSTTACGGGTPAFTGSVTNSCSVTIVFQWQVWNGSVWTTIVAAGSNPTYSGWTTGTLSLSGIVIGNNNYQYRLSAQCTGGAGGCGGTSAFSAWSSAATLTVNTISTNPISATASNSFVCSGSPSTLTLNGGGGGTGTVVHWYSGASCAVTSVGTGIPLIVSPVATTTYWGRYEDPAPCNTNTSCASVQVSVTAPVTPTITVTSNPAASGGIITTCSGNLVSFTSTQTNQGASPTYQWYKNGLPISLATS